MLRNLNQTRAGRRILGVPWVGILAARIVTDTASGDAGPGLLFDEAQAQAGHLLRLHVTSTPASGSLFVFENGAFELAGAADGAYSIGYDWYLDNVLAGSDAALLQVGPLHAVAPGATLTGAGGVTFGMALGVQAAEVAGAVVSGGGALTAGGAVGEDNAVASGVALSHLSTLATGLAVGEGSAAVPGVELAGAGALGAGGAAGNLTASAAGVDLSGVSLIAVGWASNGDPLSEVDPAGFYFSFERIVRFDFRAEGVSHGG